MRGDTSAEDLRGRTRRMARQLTHRGPDGEGVWADPRAGIGLGHRRLSILDLTDAGAQPMHSGDERFVLVFNGEIYNFRQLRPELEAAGLRFRGSSDTEVLLNGVVHWGVFDALQRANGMFALALWDRRERTLHLARDRVGKKPLFYGHIGPFFVFGSELDALRALPEFNADVDRTSLAAFLRYKNVPAPRSIYRGISKLQAGTLLSIDFSSEQPVHRERRFWDLREVTSRAHGDGSASGSPTAAKLDELDILLRDAIALRMVSDVPLGAFLSGGVDSSLVVALMQAQSSRPVQTFSMGFQEKAYDEATHARAVAAHLGTDHTELYVTPQQALDVLPMLPIIYDEPFADESQIPTYLVSKLAREHVTVALTGDGGDESFGGYNHYTFFDRLWRLFARLPGGARRTLAQILGLPASSTWRHLDGLASHFPDPLSSMLAAPRFHMLQSLLERERPGPFYLSTMSLWREQEALVRGTHADQGLVYDDTATPDFDDPRELAMFLDSCGYLPDDILTKVDRASMAVGLEARAPLLDYRVMEWAWGLPIEQKIHGSHGKWPLQQLVWRYIPRELMERPKMGFSVPIDAWLRGPLRDWAETLLDERRLRQEGYFNVQLVRRRWEQHRDGSRNGARDIWCVLMFQAWLDET